MGNFDITKFSKETQEKILEIRKSIKEKIEEIKKQSDNSNKEEIQGEENDL